MSSIIRWDPMREVPTLRDAINDIFEQAVMRPGFPALNGVNAGQMNVLEAEGKYICQVLLPGVSADAIELTVRQNTLTLKATLPDTPLGALGATSAQQNGQNGQKKIAYLLHEFGGGEVNRTVTFPKDVNGDAVDAHFDQGVLTITIPLAQHAQPKRVTINTANQGAPKEQTVLADVTR
ncbi:MAG TPA: Hsp20/alpha crystallin family protein [Ktedonobacterales bacterium]|nr:Hsp20/alpha crystallin family protein [Ktedonobacterales bacterium]